MTARQAPSPVASRARGLLPSHIGLMGQKALLNLAILAVIWTVLAILQPRFLAVENLTNMLRQIAPVVTVGSVVTLLMVSRNFDLSIGGVVALSGCVAVMLTTLGWTVPTAFVALMVTPVTPASVAVPLITPVLVSTDNPGGRFVALKLVGLLSAVIL